MQLRPSLTPIMVCFFLPLYLTCPVTGEENPIKPKLNSTGTVTAKTSGGGSNRFICGTYRGIEKEIMWNYYQFKAREKSLKKSGTRLTSRDFVSDDVWVVEDDGTVLTVGFNPFDTDMQTFHFEPNASGGYDISAIAFNYDFVVGSNLNLGDDTNTTRNLPFTFKYYGVDWTDIHINANGIISFGVDVNPSGFFDENDFFSELPKIAPYFMDLDPSVGGGVFLKSATDKMTITWKAVPEFGTNNSNTLQLVLYQDASFDVTFNGINAKSQTNNRAIVFGIHPGGQPNLEIISYSDDLPFVGGPGAGILESYLNIQQPIVNDVGLMNRFYLSFADSFFQAIFFTNFTQTMGGFANEVNIKNNIAGIGLGVFDFSEVLGSNGVLESRLNMNRISAWPNDPRQRFFGDGNNFLTILGQEAGHRWGAFVNFIDSNGELSNLILGRSDAHWSYYVDVDHSSLEGGNWQPVSENLFTTPTQIDFFGDIDEYIMGLRTPEEVTPTFYVSSPTNNLPRNRDNGTPVMGATATGTAVEVTIEDIIAAEGPRIPTETDAPKDLRQAFILIVRNGTTPSQAELNKISTFRRAWEDYFEIAVDGRIALNTSLTRTFPIAVIKGHVVDAVTQQPISDITVKSVERKFEQFVPAGGRYTFRYMADENSGSAEDITVIAEAPGYVADTLTTSIQYGSELAFDFALNPNTTAVEEVAANVPAVYLLQQNYPNPFNPTTIIRYELATVSEVKLAVYNVLGQKIKTLVNERQSAGAYLTKWDGADDRGEPVANGVYVLQLRAADFVQSRKMVLLR